MVAEEMITQLKILIFFLERGFKLFDMYGEELSSKDLEIKFIV